MRKRNLFVMPVALFMLLSAVSCGGSDVSTNNKKWEYKVKRVGGMVTSDENSEFRAKLVMADEDELNRMGEEGWELIDTYEETETTYPNWGNEKYVTGIQPNVRTMSVVFLFKRPVTAVKKDDKPKKAQ